MSRQQRTDEQQAIWDEAAANTGQVRRGLRNELLTMAAVLLLACGGVLFFIYR